MRYIHAVYKLNKDIDINTLKNYGFKMGINNRLTYKFVVYKYVVNEQPLIFCEFIFDEDEHVVRIVVRDINGNDYNFNMEEFGISDVIAKINKKIDDELNVLRRNGVL